MPMRYLWNEDTLMRTGRPKAQLALSDEERSQLQSLARNRSLPAALSSRARIVLCSADGELNSAIAARLKLTKATVGKWRSRFIERRIAGLYDGIRPGAPRTIDDERIAQLFDTTRHTKPANGSTHWSVRGVAAETGISKTSVQRYFQLFGLQPHRTEGFKLSNDPFFVDKLRDVVAHVSVGLHTPGLVLERKRPLAGPVAGLPPQGAAGRARRSGISRWRKCPRPWFP